MCMAVGFEAAEKELAEILDGYVSAEKGREDAKSGWLQSRGREVLLPIPLKPSCSLHLQQTRSLRS